MPDSKENLEVLIRTRADTTGAKQASAALKEVADTSKASTEATRADGAAMDDAAKKTGFLGLEKEKLNGLIEKLSQNFPAAGMAARAMMNPILAAAVAGVMAFNRVKRSLDEWNAKMDEAEKRNANRDFLPGIKAHAASIREAIIAHVDFQRSLSDSLGKEDAFLTKLNDATAKLHEYAQVQAEIYDAEMANKLAAVDVAEKQGIMKPAEAIRSRAAIREEARKRKDDLKTQTENQELANKRSELDHAQILKPFIEVNQKVSEEMAREMKAKLAKVSADIPGAEKYAEEARQRATSAQEALPEAERKYRAKVVAFGHWAADKDWQDAQWEVQRTDLEAQSASKRLAKLRMQEKNLAEKVVPNAEHDSAFWNEQLSSNQATIQRLRNEVPATAERVRMRQEGRAVVSRYADSTGDLGAAKELADLKAQLNQEMTQMRESAGRMVQQTGKLTEGFLESFRQVIQKFEAANSQLQAQLKNLR